MIKTTTRVEKPWGHEIIWAVTNRYVGKILFINKGGRLSRQYHNIKEETIMVLDGVLHLEAGPYFEGDTIHVHELTAGEVFHVPPGTIHRFCAEQGDVRLVETSTTEIDDVVRLEDDYKRIVKHPAPLKSGDK
jgi:quercetin dioxygenase-like cupin family protein